MLMSRRVAVQDESIRSSWDQRREPKSSTFIRDKPTGRTSASTLVFAGHVGTARRRQLASAGVDGRRRGPHRVGSCRSARVSAGLLPRVARGVTRPCRRHGYAGGHSSGSTPSRCVRPRLGLRLRGRFNPGRRHIGRRMDSRTSPSGTRTCRGADILVLTDPIRPLSDTETPAP